MSKLFQPHRFHLEIDMDQPSLVISKSDMMSPSQGGSTGARVLIAGM